MENEVETEDESFYNILQYTMYCFCMYKTYSINQSNKNNNKQS
jgi:hypothetical protein